MSLSFANKNNKPYSNINANVNNSSNKENNNSKEHKNNQKIIFYIGDAPSEDTIINFSEQTKLQDKPILTPRHNSHYNTLTNDHTISIVGNNAENVQCSNIMIKLVMYVLDLVF